MDADRVRHYTDDKQRRFEVWLSQRTIEDKQREREFYAVCENVDRYTDMQAWAHRHRLNDLKDMADGKPKLILGKSLQNAAPQIMERVYANG